MRSWIIAAALALAATPALADTLPAPTPEGVAVRLSDAQNGQTVAAARGDKIAIELQSNPSTGGHWAVSAKPNFLSTEDEREGPVESTGDDETGAPIWQVFVFSANGVGVGSLTLELRGPGGQLWDTFSVTVSAR